MGPVVSARRQDERDLRAREQLKFRIYSAARDVVLATRLFRSNFQLHEPEITVNIYARFVDLNVCLNEAQLRLIPVESRPRDLELFAQELKSGVEKLAAGLQLDFTVDPAKFGGSETIMLGSTPIGFRAVLLRSERS
jgi:hypothetical protein